MRLLAALTFFTRLPFWRIREIPADQFKRVVPLWPVAGWLTGFVTAFVLWLCGSFLPLTLAWILALLSRLLLTGCLHEDGLADFIDGFGGGTSRERVLGIMKDSHIGTYGVIGLIVYFALMLQLPTSLSRDTLCLLVLCGDCWSKCCAAQLINFLPYARTEETAKNKTVYERMTLPELLLCAFFGLAPAFVMAFALHWLPVSFLWLLLVPLCVMLLLALLMRRKIQGYTGDCCGATFLLCELLFYLSAVLMVHCL
ncbi:MAG: adenosylcobinamide-GDP ribazoletransferase [Bacteroidales bacterium]|nr:adenosylcobinamide-GDP ribazoletransferase [Bacteroidales bacterium]